MDDRAVKVLGKHLENKNIAILVSNGIARYKIPSLIRHIRQYGGEEGVNVNVYMTNTAYSKADIEAIEWASLNKPIHELGPNVEHLTEHDAYIIAPATYNTIGKFANGIADNAVTSTLASAIGRMESGDASILIAPTMHGTMQNSIYMENLEKLTSKGVKVIKPADKGDGKASLPSSHSIVVDTIRAVSDSPVKGKEFLITAGPTAGQIDHVRWIINIFRGRSGIAIADEAYMRGAEVKLILGPGGIPSPSYIPTTKIRTFDDYYATVMDYVENNHYDCGIFSAAVNDYIPKTVKKGKIRSKGGMKNIPLKETAKVIEEVRKCKPDMFMTTFKYEDNLTPEQLEEIAIGRAQSYQLIVANRGEDMTPDSHTSIIVDSSGVIKSTYSKRDTAVSLMDIIEQRL